MVIRWSFAGSQDIIIRRCYFTIIISSIISSFITVEAITATIIGYEAPTTVASTAIATTIVIIVIAAITTN